LIILGAGVASAIQNSVTGLTIFCRYYDFYGIM